MSSENEYCGSLTTYKRLKTLEVKVGNLNIGGDNPIRLQSMTTTNTMDTSASVEQAVQMINAGCEIVRFTAPSIKEAKNLQNIKADLERLGYNTPLVADIHFTPNAAEIAALYVDKVRINPGNYADKNKLKVSEYSTSSYQKQLELVQSKFSPLVLLCKENNTAIRIGTNHGSLSDRIMSKFGDTPLGMVESALEFVDVCESHNYHNIIISMKSSNPIVKIQAYRLLMARMKQRGIVYPLHLGVTEAGEGEDGRIKSAIGIGALLEDGIGDTIRVSLTEAPEMELPVAKIIANRYSNLKVSVHPFDHNLPYNPFNYSKRKTKIVKNIGGDNMPIIIADLSYLEEIKPSHFFPYGYNYHHQNDEWTIKDQAVDYIYTGDLIPGFKLPKTLNIICNASRYSGQNQFFPIQTVTEFENSIKTTDKPNFIRINAKDIAFLKRHKNVLNKFCSTVLLVQSVASNNIFEMRRFFLELMYLNIDIPIIINYKYNSTTEEQFLLYASIDLGTHLIDGHGDGIMLTTNKQFTNPHQINSIAFGILQATRTRISKTEFISCPSCGRTLFDLEKTTAKIKAKTKHLKGLKIGIMGCIVNGPGEMADADYGYVGTGKGKVNLYKSKKLVKRNVLEENALTELIKLIQENGDWNDFNCKE